MLTRRIGLVLVLLWVAKPSVAHPVPFTYLDLVLQADRIDASLVAHSFDLAHDLGMAAPDTLLTPSVAEQRRSAIIALFGPRLALAADGRDLQASWGALEVLPDRQSLKLRLTYRLAAGSGLLRVRAGMFPYDPNHQTFVNVYERGTLTHQAILSRGRTTLDYYAGTRQGTIAVLRRFIPSGIHHILIGPDHILFLIGLLLLGGRLRQLLFIVTAFTVAHSVTLSLAALNVLSPPARVIEPAIALSIVYVGIDNLMMTAPAMMGGRDVRAWIALAFGFIHGFGFANVLREMDLPTRALGWSLFSFNFGVEIGQLLIVAVVAALLAAVRTRSLAASRLVAVAGSVVVIVAGAFWFVQRVFFAGGLS